MSKPCEKCGGRGSLLTGTEARNMRVSRKLTLNHLSHKMGISLSFLADLETDRRSWTADLEEKLRTALK